MPSRSMGGASIVTQLRISRVSVFMMGFLLADSFENLLVFLGDTQDLLLAFALVEGLGGFFGGFFTTLVDV